jgi:hypothetical protein
MATSTTSSRYRGLGAASLSLGLLGLALFWWVPFGLILSAAGLGLGLLGWGLAAWNGASGSPLSVGGAALSAAAFGLNLVVSSDMLHLWTP